jgi:glutamyl-tRNA synthetase
MRGMDWLPSTPKHILLYEAFDWEIPVYIHLPNIKELGGSKKLSKRFGSVFASEFLKEGYLPDAVINFLMFLGWNPGTEKEFYTLEEFISDFSIERLQKTDLVSFDRDKLLWFNGQYIRKLSDEDLYSEIENWANKHGYNLPGVEKSREYNLEVLKLVKERIEMLSEFIELTDYFYKDPKVDSKVLHKFSKSEERTAEILTSFNGLFTSVNLSDWTLDSLEKECKDLLQKEEFTPKEAYMTLRVVLTGKTASPHIFDVLYVLGKDVVLKRIKEHTV